MKYEIIEPGFYYHIYNQGNNGENIFFEQRNYGYFLMLFKKYVSPITEIFAYSLLSNRFHFLLRVNEDVDVKKCSQIFSNFFNAYAKSINKAYGRKGSLFKRKFSRIKVSNEDYLKRLVLYIHTNAQHHGIVPKFEYYKHSSYEAYISNKNSDVSRDYILDLYGGVENFKVAHKNQSDCLNTKFEEYLLE